MVEVSKLRSLEIYTNTGHYVGRVEDVVLNIRLGTISKLQVRAIEQERKPAGFVNSFLGFWLGCKLKHLPTKFLECSAGTLLILLGLKALL